MSKRRKVNESVNGGWRGCKDVEMYSHGSLADPDLYIEVMGRGFYFNYWDIEDGLWREFLEETGHKDSESGDPAVEEEFNKYCQEEAYNYMVACIEGGYFGDVNGDSEYCCDDFCSWRPSDIKEYEEENKSDDDWDDDDDDIDEGCHGKKKSKKKLSESRGWKIELVSGPALKDAISNDDMELTLDCLADCWREINEKMPDIYEDDDLEKDLEEIENQRDNLENYDEYGMSYEDVEDEINYLLNEFYEFCDNTRIWVGLG